MPVLLGGGVPRRATLVLDDDVYEELVRISVKRYGTARALSRVANELLRKALRALIG